MLLIACISSYNQTRLENPYISPTLMAIFAKSLQLLGNDNTYEIALQLSTV